MVNSNPETASTDYDTSDLLFFEPLTFEDVMRVIRGIAARGKIRVILQFGGQTALKPDKFTRKNGFAALACASAGKRCSTRRS